MTREIIRDINVYYDESPEDNARGFVGDYIEYERGVPVKDTGLDEGKDSFWKRNKRMPANTKELAESIYISLIDDNQIDIGASPGKVKFDISLLSRLELSGQSPIRYMEGDILTKRELNERELGETMSELVKLLEPHKP